MRTLFPLFRLIHLLGQRVFFPILWTLITLALLCMPGSTIPGVGFFGFKHIDKVAHFILFGGFVLFWGIWAAAKTMEENRYKKNWIYLVLISIAIGVVMEFVQINFIPNRSFDVWDIVWDAIGSICFWWLLRSRGQAWKLI